MRLQAPALKAGLHATPRASLRLSRQSHVRVQAIGFDFGDREAADPPRQSRKTLTNLGTVSASLLVASPVMKSGAVSEAFLACLAATQKFQASSKDVLASYSKFYNLLISAGYDSWSDYVLDQLLMGRDNPVARSVAQGSLEDGAPVLSALAHDLDLLQVLAVDLPQLAEYVGESAPFGGAEWVTAGSDPSFKRKTKLLGSGAAPSVSALNISTYSRFITRPPTPDELTQWKETIASKELWSQAVPVIRQFWHLHGFGITSRNTTLRWSKGALEEAPDRGVPSSSTSSPSLASITSTGPLSVLESLRAALAANTHKHLDGRPASHILVAGPTGSGKSWLLWDSVLEEGRERGIRLVDLNGADGATILEAARGCGRYPRLRFILVADHVDIPLRGSGAVELMAGLSSVGPAGWPSNTLLYLGATANSTVSMDDPVVARFSSLLLTKALTEEQFCTTLSEIVTQRVEAANTGAGGKVSKELVQVPDEELQAALKWARRSTGGLSVRTAALYLDKFFEA